MTDRDRMRFDLERRVADRCATIQLELAAARRKVTRLEADLAAQRALLEVDPDQLELPGTTVVARMEQRTVDQLERRRRRNG